MSEDRPTISSSRVNAVDVARHSFGTVRRGFDPQEVRAYLELVARELQSWEQREQELRHDVSEAEERARHPVLDEATLTSALGEQSAQVLRHAHEEAARIAAEAESEAARLVHEAQQRANEVQVGAESQAAARIAEIELAAGAVRQRADEEAAGLLEAARADGDALIARARDHGRSMVDQAQEARRRVLADMAQRRRALTLQIEQFRAARDALATAVLTVRDEVDQIVADLSRADDRARSAAAKVASRQPPEPSEAQLLVEAEAAVAALEADTELAGIGLAGPAQREHAEHRQAGDGGPTAEPFDAAEGTPGLAAGGEPGTVEHGAGEDTGEVPSAPAEPISNAPSEPAGGRRPARSVANGTGGRRNGGSGHDRPDEGNPGGEATVEAQSVEELFARLRAGRGDDDAGPPQGHPGAETVVIHDAVPAAAAGQPREATLSEPAASPGERESSAPTALAVEEDAELVGDTDADADAHAEPSEDQRLLARRAELLDPIAAKLARRLKRALQDDQNHLLDRLRAANGQWSEEALGAEDEQRARYTEASVALLREAVAAGIAFGTESTGGRARKPPAAPDDRAARAAADALARTVVTLLRRRLVGSEGMPEGADDAERVGAAYREWRGERIERLVGDQAIHAFSAGVLVATKKGGGVRWVLGGDGDPCADCDDNALSGVLAPGEEFPTGHFHPPAHPGCRCLVAPTSA